MRDRPRLELADLHLDIGAKNREEAESLVRVGDAGVWAGPPVELPNDRLLSQALDNRLGAYIALESARRVAEAGDAQVDVVAVAAVQEEIGLYGARAAAFGLDPQVAIAVDVTPATDYPGGDARRAGRDRAREGRDDRARPDAEQARHRPARRGRGGARASRTRSRSTRAITSTDADEIHLARAGVPTGLLSIPTRYLHSPNELCDLADVESIVQLIVAFARALDARPVLRALMADRSVIVSAVRTPFGKLGGGLAALRGDGARRRSRSRRRSSGSGSSRTSRST